MIVNIEGSEGCDLLKIAETVRNHLVENGVASFVIHDIKVDVNVAGENIYSYTTSGETLSSMTFDELKPDLYYGEGYVIIVVGGTASQAMVAFDKQAKETNVMPREFFLKETLNTVWPVPDRVFNVKKYKGTLNILGQTDARLDICERAMSKLRQGNLDYLWSNVYIRPEENINEVETGVLIGHDILN